MKKAEKIVERFKTEIEVYRLVLEDKETPAVGKVLLGIAIGYLFLPFDLIPDFIPILGQLDDLIIVPLLVVFALKLIPPEVVKKNRKAIKTAHRDR